MPSRGGGRGRHPRAEPGYRVPIYETGNMSLGGGAPSVEPCGPVDCISGHPSAGSTTSRASHATRTLGVTVEWSPGEHLTGRERRSPLSVPS